MAGMPWVKVYTGLLDDPDFNSLPDSAKWRYVQLLLVAGECDAEGYFATGTGGEVGVNGLAWRLRTDPVTLAYDMEQLLKAGFLDREDGPEGALYLPEFAEQQGRRQSAKREAWRERKRRQREREQGPDNATGIQIPLPEGEVSRVIVEGVTGDKGQCHAANEQGEGGNEGDPPDPPEQAAPEPPIATNKPNPLTAGQRYWLASFGAKRFANHIQRDAVAKLEETGGSSERFQRAVNWAAKKGISMGNAVVAVEGAYAKGMFLDDGGPKQKRGKTKHDDKDAEGARQFSEALAARGGSLGLRTVVQEERPPASTPG